MQKLQYIWQGGYKECKIEYARYLFISKYYNNRYSINSEKDGSLNL